MKFSWIYEKNSSQPIKIFLKECGISKKLLAKIKFQGGKILLNGQIQNVLFTLNNHDLLEIVIPDEIGHDTVVPMAEPLEIIFEDEHFLIVNKPAGVASIPSQYHPTATMANRVKYYYQSQNYIDQIIHVVTRLDRDTTGLMLFAKHGFAHSLMDQKLRKKQVIKKYVALVIDQEHHLKAHDQIELPIARDTNSLVRRTVSNAGKSAKTEYWMKKTFSSFAAVEIQLHTGRTHQIRVHFSAIGCPLLGDDLYGGSMEMGIKRQALHCSQLRFIHPFTGENCFFEQALPCDMAEIIQRHSKE